MPESVVEQARASPKAAVLALLGAALGCYSALCGIGGGVFAVPILVYGFRLPMQRAVANSLVLVAASTTSATAFESMHPERAFHAPTLFVLVPCALIGTWLGYLVGKRLSTRTLKQVFVALLLLVGTWVLVDAARGHDDAGASLRTLERCFLAETGLGLAQWRTRLRLAVALERLGAGTSVTEAAHAVGYDSVAAFSRAFRQAHGFAPSRVRRGAAASASA